MSYIPRLNYVSNEEIAKLHQYGVDILKKTGYAGRRSRRTRYASVNMAVRKKDNRVYFSDSLIEEMLKAQKGKVTMTSPVTGMKKRNGNWQNLCPQHRRRSLDRRYEKPEKGRKRSSVRPDRHRFVS